MIVLGTGGVGDRIMTVSKERVTERLDCFPRMKGTAWTWPCVFNLDWRHDARYNSLGVGERITGQQDGYCES